MIVRTNHLRPAPFPASARWAFVIAVLSAIGAILGWIFAPDAFYHGYLVAFLLWVGAVLGSAVTLMTHHLVGGRWGRPLRPLLEAALLTTPLFAVLFIPLLFGLRDLYPWADARLVAGDEVLRHKRPYLNTSFFIVRAGAFFFIWIVWAWLLARWSRRQDRAAPDTPTSGHLQAFAAAGLIVYLLTISFAGIDWIASLNSDWSSSIFGLYIFVGQALTAFAALILFTLGIQIRTRMGGAGVPPVLREPHTTDPAVLPSPAHPLTPSPHHPQDPPQPTAVHDLGNLLLTLVVFHTYLAYSQFFISWNGNLPGHVGWYAPRMQGLWGVLAVALIVFHFFLPFCALLARRVKRNPVPLLLVAAVVLVARVGDLAWMVLPSARSAPWLSVLLTLAALVAIGGLWLVVLTRQYARVWPEEIPA
jgi:hypothetical protein